MNGLKKLLIGISLCMFMVGTVAGQSLSGEYRTAVGLRAGETSGLSLKFNTKSPASYEFVLGIWDNWISLTGLYEKRAEAFNVNGMKWYYGAGGHLAFETNNYYEGGRYYTRSNDFALGVDGIVGLEYKIPQIPFAVSVDIKPLLEIYRNGNFYLSADPGVGVKFTF